MNVNEIINIIDRAHEALEDKGWYVYSYQGFSVNNGGRMEFHLTIRPPYNTIYEEGWKSEDNINIKETCSGIADLNACKDRFLKRVLEHPTIVDYTRGRFRQRLVDMAEEGERLGFAMEYVELLRATSVKLATNALTIDAKVEP